ncbi:MAG: thermonuclease family protein [Mesorhizobium sp.]|nr:thermonuclease family protein [Mesorhizobium sp.]MCO5085138.1 thermonuclease family protein [Rhizobiaceae bacterium]MCO5164685.1 thermonuclease family protein [Mesorhizobium sp.]
MRFALAALLLLTSPAFGDEIAGRASVVDGDTIEIGGRRIRLHGIDAPESWQVCHDKSGARYRCGAVAAKALDEILSASRPTRCTISSYDRYQRPVATCWRADGREINSMMVTAGLALDWRKYSRGRYAREQTDAREHRRGLWSGSFTPPWIARSRKR